MPLIQPQKIVMHPQATPDLKASQQAGTLSSCATTNTTDLAIPRTEVAARSDPTSTAAHPRQLSINTSTATSEAIRTHSYWSGFYKKTIKERRTQLSLAFPHLARLTPLDSFASTQTSTKTSGQSTPSLGPTRALVMTTSTIPPSTLLSSSPLTRSLRPPLAPPMSRSNSSSLQNSITAAALDLEETTLNASPEAAGSPQSPVVVAEESLLNYTDDGKLSSSGSTDHDKSLQPPQQSSPRSQDMDQERRALDLELGQGQEAEQMTEEERRDQFEKERTATVISNLAEQRKMIGSADGKLLEGDLSLHARLDALIATEQEGAPFPVYGLDEKIADNMIENCIGTLGLPMGLGFNFTINGLPLVVPMAIEEPSVVAAVSSAAKTISSYQGFQAWAPERNMIIAQVQLLDILDSEMDQVVAKMEDQEKVIREEANEYCTNMVLRGGGVQRVTFHRVRRHMNRESFKGQDLLVKYGIVRAQSLPARTLPSGSQERGRCSEWLVVHLHIGVGDAMGANCANTVAEGIAPFLAKLSGGRIGVRILSNLNVDRIAKSTFRLPFSHMGYKSVPGHEVAVRILEAFEWADLDPYRAATHNKGIMNGIDAVALATGQDWRAIEAGAHAWASGAGTHSERSTQVKTSSSISPLPSSCKLAIGDTTQSNGAKRKFGDMANVDGNCDADKSTIHRGDAYKPLTRYWIEEDEERLRQGYKGQDALVFCGELEIPIMVGTKGGVLSTNPVHAFALGVMRYPDSKQLAMAMVTVGLAQNFAALRALVTEGIQRGHMALHARNIAISAGTPPASVDEVTAYMIDTGKIRLGVAKSYIEQRGLGLGLTPFYSNSGMSSNLALTTTTTTTTTTTITTNGTDSSHGLNGIVLATRRRAK